MYTRLKKSDTWHWRADCSHFPKPDAAVVTRESKPVKGELCDECLAKDHPRTTIVPDQGLPGATNMSKKTDRLAAKAREAAEKAEKEAQIAADKVAASEAADREEALKSPADKAIERAFVSGTLPEKDRRAPDALPDGNPNFPAAGPPNVPSEQPSSFPQSAGRTDAPLFTDEVPPTGVRSPASREVDVLPRSAALDLVPGTGVPPLVPAPSTNPAPPQPRPGAPVIAESVETRGPLVPLVPLAEVHPSTVESAIRDQRIPNDQINGVFEDADGTKRDALGHPFK